MKGFTVDSPEDWDLDDRSMTGCRRNTPLNCAGIANSTTVGLADKFYAMPATRLPYDPRSATGHVAGASDCEQVCLSNCSCTAYSFGTGGCSLWYGGLLNVKQQHTDDDSSGNGEVLHIRLAAKEFHDRKKSMPVILGAIGASIIALGVLVLILVLWTRRNKRYSRTLDNIHSGSGLVSFRYSGCGW
jgi:hypothetical protein